MHSQKVGDAPSFPLSVLSRMVARLVRLRQHFRGTYPVFAELMRRVDVETAEQEFARSDRDQTISRLSLLTGIHRQDTNRLRVLNTLPETATESGVRHLRTSMIWPRGMPKTKNPQAPTASRSVSLSFMKGKAMKPNPMRSALLAGACMLCLSGCANSGTSVGREGVDTSGLVNPSPFLDRMLAQSKAFPERCTTVTWAPLAVLRLLANNCRP
jgi:hypothetical protein